MRPSSEYATTSFQDEFNFFPYVVVYMILLYFCLSTFFAYSFSTGKYTSKWQNRQPKSATESTCEICCAYFKGMFCCCCKILSSCCCCCVTKLRPALYFDSSYESHLGLLGALILLVGRVLFAAFIAYYDLYQPTESNQYKFLYGYTAWTHICLLVYFIISSICSIVGLFGRLCCSSEESRRIKWSPFIENIGLGNLVLFKMSAANIVFITVVQLFAIDSSTDFGQIKLYLVPTAFVIFELFFDRLPFRLSFYFFAATLPMAYLVFQWVLAYIGELTWQYGFLRTRSAICFRYYSTMAGLHVGSFLAIAALFIARDFLLGIKYSDRFRGDDDEGDSDVEEGRFIVVHNHSIPDGDGAPQVASAPPLSGESDDEYHPYAHASKEFHYENPELPRSDIE